MSAEPKITEAPTKPDLAVEASKKYNNELKIYLIDFENRLSQIKQTSLELTRLIEQYETELSALKSLTV